MRYATLRSRDAFSVGLLHLGAKDLATPNPPTTRTARGCHPCLRYVLLPMCPGRTRNDEDWSSGFEQRRLNDDILGRMIPAAFKLANDGKIESSCDMRKLRWYVANASFNPARFG